jgi:hypothetical protein
MEKEKPSHDTAFDIFTAIAWSSKRLLEVGFRTEKDSDKSLGGGYFLKTSPCCSSFHVFSWFRERQ